MKSKNVVMASAAAAGAAYLLALPGLRRWYSKWGATKEEVTLVAHTGFEPVLPP
jgi:hypothetical protein